jgi:hypothetical protein
MYVFFAKVGDHMISPWPYFGPNWKVLGAKDPYYL